MRRFLESAARRLSFVRELESQRDEARATITDLIKRQGFAPPGHFYSPIPDFEEIAKSESRIFGPAPRTLPGIELNEDDQLRLLKQFAPHYKGMPFDARAVEGLRYYFENPHFTYTDGIFLHCMIRHLKPKRIIETGSGFSSCVMLDTNERFFGGAIDLTFIEPYPDLFRALLKPGDESAIELVPSKLQDVDRSVFDQLTAGDILFIDSTHVSKIGSDVNYLFLEILPRLAPRVYVHVHDIFYPFEYPKEWIEAGRAWNEAYLLRAFLEFNSAFQVVLFANYLAQFHEAKLRESTPLCLMGPPGGSIWLRRT